MLSTFIHMLLLEFIMGIIYLEYIMGSKAVFSLLLSKNDIRHPLPLPLPLSVLSGPGHKRIMSEKGVIV